MIDALSLGNQFWPILALDHGLTVGNDDSVPLLVLPNLLENCQEDIGAVIMTYGLARFVRSYNKLPLVIQCFGAPLEYPKFQVCTVDQALHLGAQGLAVQVDFALTKEALSYQLRSVSALVGHAHAANLPVLFMIAPQEITSPALLYQNIRFCIELGADLIKSSYSIVTLDNENHSDFKEFLGTSPPVLLAGGKVNDKILSEVRLARDLGFSGYCIGRNIFQARNPLLMSRMLRDAWLI